MFARLPRMATNWAAANSQAAQFVDHRCCSILVLIEFIWCACCWGADSCRLFEDSSRSGVSLNNLAVDHDCHRLSLARCNLIILSFEFATFHSRMFITVQAYICLTCSHAVCRCSYSMWQGGLAIEYCVCSGGVANRAGMLGREVSYHGIWWGIGEMGAWMRDARGGTRYVGNGLGW